MGTLPLHHHIKTAVIPGGAAGDHKISQHRLGPTATLIAVTQVSADLQTVADLTSEFSSSDQLINNDGGTAMSGDFLAVTWHQPS